MLIGFYNMSVVLTYAGLSSSVFGMSLVLTGNYRWAFFCLMLSGVCDMFDGKVARAMKNRTKQAKEFGVQIDSLCDVICFGVFPALIGYSLSENKVLGMAAAILFVLGAVIRLGYFNVMELERQQQTTEHRKYYQGLPVTSSALFLPAVYAGLNLLHMSNLSMWFSMTQIVIAFLFILNFKVKKPGNIGMCIMGVSGIAIFAVILSVVR